MYIKKHKTIFVIGAIILFLTIAIAFISTIWPRYEDRFFEFGLLGKDKMAEGYYPNDNSSIDVGSQVNWYIYVHNHMGRYQNVIVRVKLLNFTMELPNNSEHKPSPFIPIVEFPLSLSVKDTSFILFSWTSVEVISQKNSTILKSMMVNDQIVEVNVPASSNSFFRMVFELWVQDQISGEYRFGWESSEGFSSASIYIGFKLNSIAD